MAVDFWESAYSIEDVNSFLDFLDVGYGSFASSGLGIFSAVNKANDLAQAQPEKFTAWLALRRLRGRS